EQAGRQPHHGDSVRRRSTAHCRVAEALSARRVRDCEGHGRFRESQVRRGRIQNTLASAPQIGQPRESGRGEPAVKPQEDSTMTRASWITLLASVMLSGLALPGWSEDGKGQRPLREIENSIGMKLVLIPQGKFTMGSPGGEKGRNQ